MTDVTIDSSYVLPSDPNDRKKIKSLLNEIAGQLQQIDDKRSYIKDATDELKQKFKMPKRLVGKLAKTIHKANYAEIAEEQDLFKLFYEEVVDKVQVAPSLSNLNTDDE